MGRIVKIFLTILLLGLCVPGIEWIRPAQEAPLCAVVTGVEVTCRYGDTVLRRQYHSQEKLGAVLTYLRLLDPQPLTDTDPEAVAGERYHIRLQFSSGPDKVYYQHSDRFLSVDRKPWQMIDRAAAGTLHALMEAIPGDTL